MSTFPRTGPCPVTTASRGLRERVESEVRGVLTGVGMNEAVTFSLVDEALAQPGRPRRRAGSRCGSTTPAASVRSPCGRA